MIGKIMFCLSEAAVKKKKHMSPRRNPVNFRDFGVVPRNTVYPEDEKRTRVDHGAARIVELRWTVLRDDKIAPSVHTE